MNFLTSPRALKACAMFGLFPLDSVDRVSPLESAAFDVAATIDRTLAPGKLALITGPSGGGKSTILRALAARLEESAIIAADPATHARLKPIVDLFDSPLEATLRTLARAGLADATLFSRTPQELSDGQRARLAFALAMDRARAAGATPTLLADEFASTLDRTTARSLSLTLRRWLASAPPLRLILATAHDDLLEPLKPDLLVYIPLGFGEGARADILSPPGDGQQKDPH